MKKKEEEVQEVVQENRDAPHTEYSSCGETDLKPVYQHFYLWNISPTLSEDNMFTYVLVKHTGNYFDMDSLTTSGVIFVAYVADCVHYDDWRQWV